jgi:hypothetical protein
MTRGLTLLLLALPIQAASPAACAPCHQAQTQSFANAGMTRALENAKTSPILKTKLTATLGRYSYEIADANLTVTDGKDALRVPIEWAFGQGAAGQTFLFQREGRWYESRVSYFSALKGLDLTLGMEAITPHNLLEAAGRLTGQAEAAKCFDCHATNVTKSPRPDLSAMTQGIQCERCHGPSESHLRNTTPMRKLGGLTTEEMSDFCGQCHRTWSQISIDGPRGIQNVRFQPYRLANSKCYDASDSRIRCTACHNPHKDVDTTAVAYDPKCLACHSVRSSKAGAHICRVASKDCVTCHMPRLELPGAHKKFTDHRIRVVKANQPYPD